VPVTSEMKNQAVSLKTVSVVDEIRAWTRTYAILVYYVE